jgi:hypothetical protein
MVQIRPSREIAMRVPLGARAGEPSGTSRSSVIGASPVASEWITRMSFQPPVGSRHRRAVGRRATKPLRRPTGRRNGAEIRVGALQVGVGLNEGDRPAVGRDDDDRIGRHAGSHL